MLKIKDLTVRYKKKIGIKNLNLEVHKGEVIGFIGSDGVGKSSALNAIAGVLKFEGKISYKGMSYTSPKEALEVKKQIGYMPQGIGLVLYDTLTVSEHLDFFADIRDITIDAEFLEYKQNLLKMSGLERFLQRKAGELSGGMMQKLSLICTILHRPSLLILDEPTTGVDPLSRIEFWEILKHNSQNYGAISIVSTAYMNEASKMDRVVLFDQSTAIAIGTTVELLKEIEPFVYEKTVQKFPNSLTVGEATYSLEKLDIPHQTPILESLFFINSLKHNALLPALKISQKNLAKNTNKITIKANKITKRFGKFIANESVDMELHRGEIVGLLGANGAGKTTFIKMILGLLPIDSGELSLLNKKITSAKDRQELKSKIGYVSQHFALYDDMTVRENMLFFALMHKISRKKAKELIGEYADELGFREYLDDMPRSLPLGINQRFSLAVALLHDPIILCLDEPTSGVDAIARRQFWDLLQELKIKRDISILITTHYMSEAEFCDRVVLLKDGKKIADKKIAEFYEEFPNAHDFEEIFLEYYR
ncbi:MAG: ABC transporter ATP-binding protein [Sulfurimonas sp.]|nr:ABC transporter ATP-binding protein [Sulfurimonas sp.]